MFLKCFSGASQVLLWYFSDDSQGLSRCFPSASQVLSGCFSGDSRACGLLKNFSKEQAPQQPGWQSCRSGRARAICQDLSVSEVTKPSVYCLNLVCETERYRSCQDLSEKVLTIHAKWSHRYKIRALKGWEQCANLDNPASKYRLIQDIRCKKLNS